MAIYDDSLIDNVTIDHNTIIGQIGKIDENTVITSVLSNILNITVVVNENSLIDHISNVNKEIIASLSESVLSNDTYNVQSFLNAILTDTVTIYFQGDTNETIYEAWIANARTHATWKYDNYGFNSFTKLNGYSYGCKSNGIYEIESGEDDQGDGIQTVITTGITISDTALIKGYDYMYLVLSTEGKMFLRALTNGKERVYEMKPSSLDSYGGARVQLARGLRGVSWQFELTNDGSSNFDIESILVYPLNTSRHI